MPIVAVPESQRMLVTIAAGAPSFLASALRSLEGVDVVERAPATSLVGAADVQALTLTTLDVAALRSRLDDASARWSAGRHLVAVNGVLDAETASRLQDLGVAYGDVAGNAWLPGRPRTERARKRRDTAHRHLRPESLRLAQLLADHPGRAWTQRSLAAAGDSTQVTAQRLLRRLEDAGLVGRRGTGNETAREVADDAGLREWLLEHGRPGRVVRLAFYVREPDHIPAQVAQVRLALTGARAAERIGIPVLAGQPPPVYRADCGAERLEDVPALLKGFRTEQGANAFLIADPGRLAHVDARTLADDTLVAPPSRIMLDLLLEARGAAAAQLFADLWQDRAA